MNIKFHILWIVIQNSLRDGVLRETFLNKSLRNIFQFLHNALRQIRFQFEELFKLKFFALVLIDEIFEQEEVIAIETDKHLHALVVVRLAVDVLDDLGGVGMHDQLLHLASDLWSEEGLLVVSRREVVQLRCEVVAVLRRHQVNEVLLDLVCHQLALRLVTVL